MATRKRTPRSRASKVAAQQASSVDNSDFEQQRAPAPFGAADVAEASKIVEEERYAADAVAYEVAANVAEKKRRAEQSARIFGLRQRLGVTQEKLADLLGISLPSVSRY